MNRFPLLLLLLTLGGCSVFRGEQPDWGSGNSALLQAEQWEFSGRMAIKVEDPQLQQEFKGGQVTVRWVQQQTDSRIRLSGPLGMGAWEVFWCADQITASDAKGERSIRYSGPEAAENFMRRELGWVFPADNSRYWVRDSSAGFSC